MTKNAIAVVVSSSGNGLIADFQYYKHGEQKNRRGIKKQAIDLA
jgi:hypothetical protein